MTFKTVCYQITFYILFNTFSAQAHAQSLCRFFDGFVDNGNGTVTDPRNGLIWKRCAEGRDWDGSACTNKAIEVDWYNAMTTAKQSRFSGKSNWRLPTKYETGLVVNHSCKNGAKAVSPVLAYSDDFWTSSSVNTDSKSAWIVHFQDGDLKKSYKGGHAAIGARVRLVTGGRPQDVNEFEREYAKLSDSLGGTPTDTLNVGDTVYMNMSGYSKWGVRGTVEQIASEKVKVLMEQYCSYGSRLTEDSCYVTSLTSAEWKLGNTAWVEKHRIKKTFDAIK